MATTANSNPVSVPRRVIANKVQISDPGFSTRNSGNSALADPERSYINTSIRDLRAVSPVTAIRALTRFNGIFSTAVHSYIQLAMSGYKVTAYKAGTHEFDPVATRVATSILVSLDTLYDYTIGFSDKQSTDGLLETLLKEVLHTGACCAELVLNRYTLPEKVVTVPVDTLSWVPNKDKSVYPKQRSSDGDDIELNLPTIFYASMHQVSNSKFPRSPLEAALQMLFVYTEFIEDLNKVLRRTGHSRLVIKIVQEAVKNMAPLDYVNDPKKMTDFFNTTREQIEDVIKGLEPDEALVLYDSAEVDSISAKGEKADYTELLKSLGGMMAASLKTMPSVVGLGQGSQNLATAETMVYVKLVGSIQKPVATVMSRLITLAVRLVAGVDSYCTFVFNPVNIRPPSELSAHESVIFQTHLRKLSLGLYTDEEFAHIVGTGPRAPGAPALSGTMFMDQSSTTALPNDMSLNTDGQARNLNEGTSQGSATSQGGGAPAK